MVSLETCGELVASWQRSWLVPHLQYLFVEILRVPSGKVISPFRDLNWLLHDAQTLVVSLVFVVGDLNFDQV